MTAIISNWHKSLRPKYRFVLQPSDPLLTNLSSFLFASTFESSQWGSCRCCLVFNLSHLMCTFASVLNLLSDSKTSKLSTCGRHFLELTFFPSLPTTSLSFTVYTCCSWRHKQRRRRREFVCRGDIYHRTVLWTPVWDTDRAHLCIHSFLSLIFASHPISHNR